jgi:hypothetical protein
VAAPLLIRDNVLYVREELIVREKKRRKERRRRKGRKRKEKKEEIWKIFQNLKIFREKNKRQFMKLVKIIFVQKNPNFN